MRISGSSLFPRKCNREIRADEMKISGSMGDYPYTRATQNFLHGGLHESHEWPWTQVGIWTPESPHALILPLRYRKIVFVCHCNCCDRMIAWYWCWHYAVEKYDSVWYLRWRLRHSFTDIRFLMPQNPPLMLFCVCTEVMYAKNEPYFWRVVKGELNLYNKWQSDDLFHIVINENHPRGNTFWVILKILTFMF